MTDSAPAVGAQHRVRWLLSLGLLGLSVPLALGVAEFLAVWVQGGAFPYLNIFRPDARYGVVLEADASTRVRTRRGRVTSIRTNALGFRGPAPSGRPGGVLLLGDSQALGFGVEESDTVAGRLRLAGHEVQVAAVPSWGPFEFALAAEDLVPRLEPKTVVFVANLANDWPEANVPNSERNTARDGWLSRFRPDLNETESFGFPGRSWLYARSHLVFTVRALGALHAGRTRVDATLGAPAAERLLDSVSELAMPRGGDRSRLTPFVRRTKAACSNRCRVVVLVLPMDVQVDAREWAKYGRPARDLSRLSVLGTALLEDLEPLGVTGIDLLPALEAASPGAFLDDDPHLSARGHAAVAEQLISALHAVGPISQKELSP